VGFAARAQIVAGQNQFEPIHPLSVGGLDAACISPFVRSRPSSSLINQAVLAKTLSTICNEPPQFLADVVTLRREIDCYLEACLGTCDPSDHREGWRDGARKFPRTRIPHESPTLSLRSGDVQGRSHNSDLTPNPCGTITHLVVARSVLGKSVLGIEQETTLTTLELGPVPSCSQCLAQSPPLARRLVSEPRHRAALLV
jgi:hypothetical protein